MSDDDFPPSPLNVTAMENICRSTGNAWLYYCDEHDTHGNADTQDEAEHMADAHVEYFLDLDNGEADACEVIVWQRTSHERTVD